MLEECADYLELAGKALRKKIDTIVHEEKNYLFQSDKKDLSQEDGPQGFQLSTNSTSAIEQRLQQISVESGKKAAHNHSSSSQAMLLSSTREQILSNKLHKLRYLCKFYLQLCSIQS